MVWRGERGNGEPGGHQASVCLTESFVGLENLELVSFSLSEPREPVKKQGRHFADRGPSSQSCGFPASRMDVRGGPLKKAQRRRTDAFKLVLA